MKKHYTNSQKKISAYDNIGIENTTYYIAASFVVNQLNIMKPKTILEVGVGTGRFMKYLSSNLKYNPIKIGVDRSKRMINFAKKNGLNSQLYYSNRKIPLESKSIDCVLCVNVLEEVEKQELKKLLKEINRVLKVNGKLIVTYTNPQAIQEKVKYRSYQYSSGINDLQNEDIVQCNVNSPESLSMVINDHYREVEYLKEIIMDQGLCIESVDYPLGSKAKFKDDEEAKTAPDVVFTIKKS